jgi:hypothetical protein
MIQSRSTHAQFVAREEDPCQMEDSPLYTRPGQSHFTILAMRFLHKLKEQGVRATWERALWFLRRLRQPAPAAAGKPAVRRPMGAGEVLDLQPGEWVEVKSQDEIKATLDRSGKHRGLLFTPDMNRFFGKRFRVFKRVNKIYLEESRQARHLKHTVLLEEGYCSGLDVRCDRSCFLYWREAWLKRVDGPGGEERAPVAKSSESLVQIGVRG